MSIRYRVASGENVGRSSQSRNNRRLRPELLELECRWVLSTAGTLDTSFGTGGVERFDFKPNGALAQDSTASDVAIDGSGNIVAVGSAAPVDNTQGTPATVGRLTAAGQIDTTFNGGTFLLDPGQAIQNDFSPWSNAFYDIVHDNSTTPKIQFGTNNSIILVGSHTKPVFQGVDANTDFLIMQLTQFNGIYSRNYSFGGSGNDQDDGFGGTLFGSDLISFSPLDSGEVDVAYAALYQPDGTILVSGSTEADDDSIPLVRIDINGNIDTAFPNPVGLDAQAVENDAQFDGGELLQILGDVSSPTIQAMAVLPSGKILLAGTTGLGQGLLVRLNSNDEVDTTFGNHGAMFFSSLTGVNSMAVDQDTGRIVLAGSSLLVLKADATPDASAGTNGVIALPNLSASSVALQSDGKIVVVGSQGSEAALERFNANGTPDASFGNQGLVLASDSTLTSAISSFNSVTIEDGAILAAGTESIPGTTQTTTVIARYIGETPDITTLSPTSATQGGAQFQLSVFGDNFVSNSNVLWNGATLETTVVNSTTLKATVTTANLTQFGTVNITVANGSAVSNAVPFTINPAKIVPSITWLNPAPITYGTPLSDTQLDAGVSVAGTLQYTPIKGTVLHAGLGQQLSASFTPTDTTAYTTASKNVQIDVKKFTPILDLHGVASPYDGNPHPATVTITGTNGDDLSNSVIITYNGSTTVPVQKGTYAVVATFSGTSDYNGVTANGGVIISDQVPPIIWPQPAAITYGTRLSATQLNATSPVHGTLVFTPALNTVLHAGLHQALSVTLTPDPSTGYTIAASTTVYIDVMKFTPILTLQLVGPSYDGNPHPVPIKISGPNGEDLSNQVTVTYNGGIAAPVNAGIYTVNASFPGSGDYSAVSSIKQFAIAKGSPVIAWSNPAPINGGTPLGAAQLNATHSLPGTLTYFQPAGTILAAGLGQVLSVSFAPTDSEQLQFGNKAGDDRRAGTHPATPRHAHFCRWSQEEGVDVDIRSL